MNNSIISQALQLIRPNAEWVLAGDNLENLEWLGTEQTKPTIQEIENAIAEIEQIEATLQATKAAEKSAVLAKLSLTAEEVAALLS